METTQPRHLCSSCRWFYKIPGDFYCSRPAATDDRETAELTRAAERWLAQNRSHLTPAGRGKDLELTGISTGCPGHEYPQGSGYEWFVAVILSGNVLVGTGLVEAVELSNAQATQLATELGSRLCFTNNAKARPDVSCEEKPEVGEVIEYTRTGARIVQRASEIKASVARVGAELEALADEILEGR